MNVFDEITYFLDDRKQEIRTMIELGYSSKVRETVLIKSSIILLSYNTVEGCFTRLNKEIFSFISENSIPVNKLSTELQKVYFRYYSKIINKAEDLKFFYHNRAITSVSYEEICDKLTLFSGNLDAKAIRDFSRQQLGMRNISTQYGQKMVIIKNLRNKLAHGEITFQDALRDTTMDEVEEMCKDCLKFLEVVVRAYKEFYENQIFSLIENER